MIYALNPALNLRQTPWAREKFIRRIECVKRAAYLATSTHFGI